MSLSDALLVLFLFILVFGPAFALAFYGYRKGQRLFEQKVAEVGSAFQARWQAFSGSMRAAIVPAFVALFGGIRLRVSRDPAVDQDIVWPCILAISILLLTLVIIPFMIGVQVAYRRHSRKVH
jgi:uncharacterized membrane protein